MPDRSLAGRLERFPALGRWWGLGLALALGALGTGLLSAQVAEEPPRVEDLNLKAVAVPGPPPEVLAEFVADKAAAIALGKALFWDVRVGSDNRTACASCHANAGADVRWINQISPGLLKTPQPSTTFEVGRNAPNHTLEAKDFPFTRFLTEGTNDPLHRVDADDVGSSQGVAKGAFEAVNASARGAGADRCSSSRDEFGFHVGGTNVRRVEPRNTPSVINAVFNFRNFWDGRASNVFNGGDPFGLRNPDPLVWKMEQGVLRKVAVAIPSASLASQASGPPLSEFEMSCLHRTYVHLGQKLLGQKILAEQAIAPTDSVLGAYARERPTYRSLVGRAFRPAYWQAPAPVRFTTADARSLASMDLRRSAPFNRVLDLNVNQMEANFSLFFGLALHLYQATLVSDDTPLDRHAAGDPNALGEIERWGLAVFMGKGRCINCHGGAELTNASFRNVLNQRLETMAMADGRTRTYDNGFYNIGVRPTADDLGVGGTDPFGLPLSETLVMANGWASGRQAAAAQLLGNGFDLHKNPRPDAHRVAVMGAFKTPGLRNVELTGPYFHNGGKSTLRQVVDFYDRGGDFGQDNRADLAPDILPLGMTEEEKRALVSFLLALTDDRVRREKAPFDRPSLCTPDGHPASAFGPNAALTAPDTLVCTSEVGAGGRATGLPRFLGLDPHAR